MFEIATFAASIGLAVLLYWLASRQLVQETRKLRHLNELILKALQNSGMADLNFDDDGNIVGLNVNIEVPTAELKFTTHAALVDHGSDEDKTG